MVPLFMSIMLLLQANSTAATKIYIPTSELLRVSEMAARDEGFPVNKVRPDGTRLFFFDIATTSDGKPLAPGYTSMGLYGNGQIIRIYSVNEQTGQVVDIANCAAFDFPNLSRFAKEVQREAGARPEALEQLALDVGCDNLTVIRKAFGQSGPGR
jgi:hypothetical protein